jgi:hypothetical protein
MTNNPKRPTPPPPPAIEVPPNISSSYANLVRISHTASELVFDFAHLLPGTSPAQVCARIVMSPLGAKLLQRALAENLARYESAFGEIKVPGESGTLADFLFHPPAPQNGEPPKE